MDGNLFFNGAAGVLVGGESRPGVGRALFRFGEPRLERLLAFRRLRESLARRAGRRIEALQRDDALQIRVHGCGTFYTQVGRRTSDAGRCDTMVRAHSSTVRAAGS